LDGILLLLIMRVIVTLQSTAVPSWTVP